MANVKDSELKISDKEKTLVTTELLNLLNDIDNARRKEIFTNMTRQDIYKIKWYSNPENWGDFGPSILCLMDPIDRLIVEKSCNKQFKPYPYLAHLRKELDKVVNNNKLKFTAKVYDSIVKEGANAFISITGERRINKPKTVKIARNRDDVNNVEFRNIRDYVITETVDIMRYNDQKSFSDIYVDVESNYDDMLNRFKLAKFLAVIRDKLSAGGFAITGVSKSIIRLNAAIQHPTTIHDPALSPMMYLPYAPESKGKMTKDGFTFSNIEDCLKYSDSVQTNVRGKRVIVKLIQSEIMTNQNGKQVAPHHVFGEVGMMEEMELSELKFNDFKEYIEWYNSFLLSVFVFKKFIPLVDFYDRVTFTLTRERLPALFNLTDVRTISTSRMMTMQTYPNVALIGLKGCGKSAFVKRYKQDVKEVKWEIIDSDDYGKFLTFIQFDIDKEKTNHNISTEYGIDFEHLSRNQRFNFLTQATKLFYITETSEREIESYFEIEMRKVVNKEKKYTEFVRQYDKILTDEDFGFRAFSLLVRNCSKYANMLYMCHDSQSASLILDCNTFRIEGFMDETFSIAYRKEQEVQHHLQEFYKSGADQRTMITFYEVLNVMRMS